MANQNIGKLTIQLLLQDAQFSKAVENAESNLLKFNNRINKFGNSIQKVLVGSFMAANAAITAFGVKSTLVGADFEQSITKVAAVAVDGVNGLEALTKKARELGASTQYTATQAADAMQDLARAGLRTNEIMDVSGPALMLAGAAGAEMSQSTSLLAATMAQFNMHSSESNRVADVFNETLRASLFDMSSLTEAMKYAGSVGAAFGMSLEETTAAVAQFRNLGLEGSMAGTNFRMAMSQAAKVTAKGERALARYGLTQKDINPELHTFGEIMQTVADAGLKASDMMDVFGVRAGANISSIAEQFRDGQANYFELLDALENSAGSAEETYEMMLDTVKSQFQIVISALEELMLSVFMTYAEPLKKLLTTLSKVIQHTAFVFNKESDNMADSFGSILESITEWLESNRIQIANTFVNFVDGLSRVVSILSTMLPLLEKVGVLIAATFVAIKVQQFVVSVKLAIATVVGMKVGVTGLSGAIAALAGTITTATGGIYALVLALGAFVATIGGYIYLTREASEVTERFALTQDKLAERDEYRRKVLLERAQSEQNANQIFLRIMEDRLATQGKLNRSLEKTIENVRSLTAHEIAAGTAAGTHFRALFDGNEIVMSVADAFELAEQGVDGSQKAMAKMMERLGTFQVQADQASQKATELAHAFEDVDEHGSGFFIKDTVTGQLKRVADSYQELSVYRDDAYKKERDLQQRFQTFANAIAAENHRRSIERKKISRDEQRDAEELARQSQEAAREFENAQKKRIKAQEKAANELRKSRADEAELIRIEFENAIAATRKAYADELALLAENSQARADLLRQRAETEQQILDTFRNREAKETSEFMREQAEALIEARNRFRDDAAAITEAAYKKELEEAKRSFDDELALYQAGTVPYLVVVAKRQQAISDIEARHELERQMARRAIFQAIEQQIENMAIEAATARGARLMKIEIDRMKMLAEHSEATEAQKARINELFDQRALKEKEKITREIIELTNFETEQSAALEDRASKTKNKKLAKFLREQADMLRQRARLEQQLADKLVDYAEASEEEKAKITAHYNRKIAELEKKTSKERQKASLEALKGVADTATSIAETVSGTIQKVVKKTVGAIKDVFSFMTGGFTFSIQDGMSAVIDSANEAEAAILEIDEALARGSITAQEYENAFVALSAFDAAEAARAFVKDLILGAARFTEQLIVALPSMLDALADKLPAMFERVSEAIPILAERVSNELPRLINVLVEGIPLLIEGVADAIPHLANIFVHFVRRALPELLRELLDALDVLIQALIDALPMVINAIVRALPEVIRVITEGVANIVRVLPDIIDALVAALPDVIEALISGVDNIVKALVKAVPKIIKAFIDNLPTIVMAIVEGILSLATTLVEQLPLLIASIIELLPDLIGAIIGMLPDVISAIIGAIPDIILAFVNSIDEIITAVIVAIPRIFVEIITRIPEIAVALVKALVEEVIFKLPQIGLEIIKAIFKGLREAFEELVQIFKDIFSRAFKGIKNIFQGSGKDGEGTGGMIGDYVDKLAGFVGLNAYSGIDYIPSNRLVTVHKGEAIISAQENRRRMAAPVGPSANQATPGISTMGGGAPIDIAIMAEGRLLDAVTVTAMDRGHAPKLERKLKKASGVTVGFERGRFNRYGRD